MARVKGPLMSMDASGSLGGVIVFSKNKGRKYVRELVIPSNPQSDLQTGMRSMMKFVTQIYASLSALIKTHWTDAGLADNINGLPAMVRSNQGRARINLGALQDPTLAPGAVEAAPTAVVATAQTKGVGLTWVDSAGADDWCTLVYSNLATGFTPAIGDLIAILPAGVQTYTDTGLDTGVPWFYRLRGCEVGGTLGTLAAEVTAIPT